MSLLKHLILSLSLALLLPTSVLANPINSRSLPPASHYTIPQANGAELLPSPYLPTELTKRATAPIGGFRLVASASTMLLNADAALISKLLSDFVTDAAQHAAPFIPELPQFVIGIGAMTITFVMKPGTTTLGTTPNIPWALVENVAEILQKRAKWGVLSAFTGSYTRASGGKSLPWLAVTLEVGKTAVLKGAETVPFTID